MVVSRVTFASESPGPGGGQLPCGFAQEASYCLCGGLPASVAMERGRAKDLWGSCYRPALFDSNMCYSILTTSTMRIPFYRWGSLRWGLVNGGWFLKDLFLCQKTGWVFLIVCFCFVLFLTITECYCVSLWGAFHLWGNTISFLPTTHMSFKTSHVIKAGPITGSHHSGYRDWSKGEGPWWKPDQSRFFPRIFLPGARARVWLSLVEKPEKV